MTPLDFGAQAKQVCQRVSDVIIEKNARYEIIQTTQAMEQLWVDIIAAALSTTWEAATLAERERLGLPPHRTPPLRQEPRL